MSLLDAGHVLVHIGDALVYPGAATTAMTALANFGNDSDTAAFAATLLLFTVVSWCAFPRLGGFP